MIARDSIDRGFTPWQRTINRWRIVSTRDAARLALAVAPAPGLDWPLSHGLFDPVTTVLSLLLILAAVAAGLTQVRRAAVALSVLWFFGNLVIESTFIRWTSSTSIGCTCPRCSHRRGRGLPAPTRWRGRPPAWLGRRAHRGLAGRLERAAQPGLARPRRDVGGRRAQVAGQGARALEPGQGVLREARLRCRARAATNARWRWIRASRAR